MRRIIFGCRIGLHELVIACRCVTLHGATIPHIDMVLAAWPCDRSIFGIAGAEQGRGRWAPPVKELRYVSKLICDKLIAVRRGTMQHMWGCIEESATYIRCHKTALRCMVHCLGLRKCLQDPFV